MSHASSSLSDISLSGSLSSYGWTSELDELFSPLAEAGLTPARIARVDRGQCDVVLADPETGELRALRADSRPVGDPDPVNCPCTGDWAAVDLAATPLPTVTALLPRGTAIIRKTSGQRSSGQVLAVNIDTVLIAVSLAAEPDLGRIERFLALAWRAARVVQRCGVLPDACRVLGRTWTSGRRTGER